MQCTWCPTRNSCKACLTVRCSSIFSSSDCRAVSIIMPHAADRQRRHADCRPGDRSMKTKRSVCLHYMSALGSSADALTSRHLWTLGRWVIWRLYHKMCTAGRLVLPEEILSFCEMLCREEPFLEGMSSWRTTKTSCPINCFFLSPQMRLPRGHI